jgi:hypothetical protein
MPSPPDPLQNHYPTSDFIRDMRQHLTEYERQPYQRTHYLKLMAYPLARKIATAWIEDEKGDLHA